MTRIDNYIWFMAKAQSMLSVITIPAFILMLLLNRPTGKAFEVFISHTIAILPFSVVWVAEQRMEDA